MATPLRTSVRFGIPTSACVSGVHKRCLLDQEACSCPCHADGGELVRAQCQTVIARPRLGYECPVCQTDFPTADARREHCNVEHPVNMRTFDVVEW